MLAQNKIMANICEFEFHKKRTPPKIVSFSTPNKEPVCMTGNKFAGIIKT